uniref:acid phosphatase n=2 Tax=Cacopsylla melanoneura TaxID=428564 RepID=A0A8D8VR30_9HEMI
MNLAVHIIVLGCLILFVTECHGLVNSRDCSSKTLVLVQVVFRHGNRTRDTSETYANNLYSQESDWMPEGFGQLTAVGRTTEYLLGQFLRSRYDEFLGRSYFYKDVTVFSSNKHRTRESAQLVCAGLYSPPTGYNKWGEGNVLGNYWQPIPIENMPKEDIWLETHTSCPPYDKELDSILHNDPMFADLNAKSADLYAFLCKQTGENVTSVREMAKLYNTLKVHEENSKLLPSWATPQLLARMEPFRLLGFTVRTQTEFMKVIKAGPLLHLMSVNLNNKTSHHLHPDNKIILYSAHDTTVVHVLNSLGATRLWDPQYGACVMIELHKVKGQFVVRVLYLESGRDHVAIPIPLQDWPSPDTAIPLETFNKILNKYEINEKDWYKECGREYCNSSQGQ